MPTIKIKTIHDCEEIKKTWNSIVSSAHPHIKNTGVSSTYEWTSAIIKSHSLHDKSGVFTSEKNGAIKFIFPYSKRIKNHFKIIKLESIEQIQEIYSSRNGLILEDNEYLHFDNFIKFLHNNTDQWDTLIFSVTSNSYHEENVNKTLEKYNLSYTNDAYIESPYIHLPESHETFINRLNKKFRYNVISRLKKLSLKKETHLKIYTSIENHNEFIEHIHYIEKKSWKEQSGTSITTNKLQEKFYNNFTELAAINNWLMGFVIFDKDIPIAYSYGILFNGVFESLKSSFSDDYKKYSPGNIIKFEITKYLCAHGIKYYDLLGVKDPMKMRWATSTYTQKRYTIFNKKIKSRIAYSATRSKNIIKYILRDTKG